MGRAFFECEINALIQLGWDFQVTERRPRHYWKVRPE
jgi:hypothetical protein